MTRSVLINHSGHYRGVWDGAQDAEIRQNGGMKEAYRKALVVIVWRSKAGAEGPKVLLLKLLPSRGGFWQSVTGGVEKGESFAQGALREAQEESGLVFEREPQYLGLEQSFPSRHGGESLERAFYLPLFGGSAPPEAVLDGKEHDEFAWVTPEHAAQHVRFPFNARAIERASAGLPPLLLSRRGSFFQEGEEITHARSAALFHRSLQREKEGHFLVACEGESLEVILEDNPRYVLSYDRGTGALSLSNGTTEKLDVDSLLVRADHSLVCELSNSWPATFLPAAFYEIAKDISESKPGEYVLHFLGRSHQLRVAR
jgi:8-oxo-dGTP pyrophosphatase MutT (NUDIX family)